MAEIVSKPTNQAYRDGWERTFRSEPEAPSCEGIVDVDVGNTPTGR